MAEDVVFTRTAPVAELVERLLGAASESMSAALYRMNSPRLGQALEEALNRGVRVRLLLDRNKYEESKVTSQWATDRRVPIRLLYGRRGPGSKMHHKFAILDAQIVLTGSYNWTLESEEQNHEDLVILRAPQVVDSYAREFEELWRAGSEP